MIDYPKPISETSYFEHIVQDQKEYFNKLSLANTTKNAETIQRQLIQKEEKSRIDMHEEKSKQDKAEKLIIQNKALKVMDLKPIRDHDERVQK